MSIASMLMCYNSGRSDKKRDAGKTTPADVERFDDIRYGMDEKFHRLDVYRPRGAEGKLPVIVSVHGGAWVYGSKEVYQFYCMSLAQRGFAVVNFTYRLAPKFKYPAAVEDINSVFQWILANADTYGLDTDKLCAVGDSAGAHLLSVYACILTNRAYASTYRTIHAPEIRLRAIALNCGKYVLDRKFVEDENLKHLKADIFPKKGSEQELRWVTPVHYVNGDFPPAFVMTAEGDFLRGQPPFLTEKLAECGVTYEYKMYGSPEQELYHVFHCNTSEPMAHVCNDEECAFFRRFLKD
ncbi:MAG: alpha/beta hydrolase [Blautia sp.]|nr:alpha/beta hydrolase [Blautia sp.]